MSLMLICVSMDLQIDSLPCRCLFEGQKFSTRIHYSLSQVAFYMKLVGLNLKNRELLMCDKHVGCVTLFLESSIRYFCD